MVLISRGFTEGCTIRSRGIMWTKGDSQHSLGQRNVKSKIEKHEQTKRFSLKKATSNSTYQNYN